MKMKILKEAMCFAQAFCLIIAIMCLCATVWCIWFLVHHEATLKDPTSVAVLMSLLGIIKTGFDAVVKYVTASSASSQAKDEIQQKNNEKMIDAVANSTPIVK